MGMKLKIVERPEKVLSDGHICKFPAAYNPQSVVVKREDYDIDGAESYPWQDYNVTKINVVEDLEGLIPTAGYAYVYALDSSDNVIIDDTFVIYPIIEFETISVTPPVFQQKLVAIALIGLQWDANYSNIAKGHIFVGTTEKYDLSVTGFVDTEDFTPRRYSFDRTGRATIYLTSIVQDYFNKRLEIEDMYCKEQALPVQLDMTVDVDVDVLPYAGIKLDYGLVACKAVQQLGSSKILEDYAIYMKEIEATLTLNVQEGGTVEIGSATYEQGQHEIPIVKDTTINLTGAPTTSWRFNEWTGAVESSDASIDILMDADKTLTAAFQEQVELTLTVNSGVTGWVVIVGTAYANGTYKIKFDKDQTITLYITNSSQWVFSEWSGALTGSEEPQDLLMDTDKSVTATFEEETVNTYELTYVVGKGGVGIINGSRHEEGSYTINIEEGEVLDLNADNALGYKFDNYTGDAGGTDPDISVTMDANKTINVNFQAEAIQTDNTWISTAERRWPTSGTISPGETYNRIGDIVLDTASQPFTVKVTGVYDISYVINGYMNVYVASLKKHNIEWYFRGAIMINGVATFFDTYTSRDWEGYGSRTESEISVATSRNNISLNAGDEVRLRGHFFVRSKTSVVSQEGTFFLKPGEIYIQIQ